VCGYNLIRLKFWGKQDVGQRARKVAKKRGDLTARIKQSILNKFKSDLNIKITTLITGLIQTLRMRSIAIHSAYKM